MIRQHSRESRRRSARARLRPLGRLWGAAALALCIGCAADAPPPPPTAVEVTRTTNEDGSVRYTLRNRPRGEIPADPDAASPSPGGEPEPSAPEGDGDSDGSEGPSAEIRGQLETDREFLREMISRDAPAGFERTQDPKLRDIAERLPRLQSELEALENEPEP